MPKARKKPQQALESRLVAIGKKLQSLRKRRGLNQKELGDKTGLTREAIAAYEAGRSGFLLTKFWGWNAGPMKRPQSADAGQNG